MGHEPAGAARERKYQRPAHSHAVARAKQSQHEHPEQIHILHRRLRAEPPSGEKKEINLDFEFGSAFPAWLIWNHAI
jgi:hypothetical protein